MNRIAGRPLLVLGLFLFWCGLQGVGATDVRALEETVCVQCHGGLNGRLQQPVGQWRESIHARNGVSCHNCHGGDPTDFGLAMSPERGFIGVPEKAAIPDFCGRCHVGVREDYFKSAHGAALGSNGPQCVTCHGNHAVARATLDLINPQDCSRCHEYGRAEILRESLAATDAMIGRLEEDFNQLRQIGIEVKVLADQTFALRNRFHRLSHSVNVEQVRSSSAGFQEELGRIRQDVESIQDALQQRKAAGGIVVGLLLVMGIMAVLIRKIYANQESADRSARDD